MAQMDTTLYNTIIDAYALIDDSLSSIEANARVALDAIVDVGATTYPDPSASLVDADAALQLELALLQTFNTAFVVAGNIQNSNAGLLDAVRAVNDFVIRNQEHSSVLTGTATVKLNYFIISQMKNAYTVASECPSGWVDMSTDAGYDTSTWTTPGPDAPS